MKKKFEVSTDAALIFSAVMILIFTAVHIYLLYIDKAVSDSLIIAFFGCFGLEGGYCTFIYKTKKKTMEGSEDERGNDQDNC